ncbi:EI24 domain-containing protein [Streptomyces sp. RFCAC02]|uniref:EI24 domain-containing protein n=1 Tax=Streptomyces sp. RFCAC02 TaxID=2499143 RepID=UPI0010209A95|nr:EI24 domain-containing protein [Streptomyces sp. RFCAC02]
MQGFATGLRYLLLGQRWVFGRPRQLLFGLLPALITFVLYAAALVALAVWAGDIAVWATPFADDWGSPWQSVLRAVFALLLVGAGVLLAVLTFAAVTLLVGEPFYEALSERVEDSVGGAPPGPDRSLWGDLVVSVRDSVQVLWRVALFTVPLFFLGFVPVLGQTVVPVLGFAVSGFFLTVELTSVAMERRGLSVPERVRILRGGMGTALGFGVPLVVLFLVPLAAVVLMPGAVAGAALLVRDLTGEPEPEPPAVGVALGKD